MDKEKTRLVKELKKFKKKLSEKYEIDKLILFGSRVKGKHRKDSDVDITIISKDFRKIPVLYRNRGLYLVWDLDYRVDFICYTPEEFERLRHKATICQTIAKEGIEIS